MAGVIIQLVQPRRRASAPAVIVPPPTASLHWAATGKFEVAAVGESFCPDAIAGIARNAPGKNAMAFCTARLVLDDLNAHDPNAVAVYIGEARVGFLAKERAVQFRTAIAGLAPHDMSLTTCDAVILKGVVAEERQYEYAVELDLTVGGTAPVMGFPKYPKVVRYDELGLRVVDVGLFGATVWLPHEAMDIADQHQSVYTYANEGWDTVAYFLENKYRIGMGHRLMAESKERHWDLFGDYEPNIEVMKIEGRWMHLLVKRQTSSR